MAPRVVVIDISDFSGMLNLAKAPYVLKPSEAQDVWDLVATRTGELRLRGGYERWGSLGSNLKIYGMHRFYTPTLTHLLAAAGTGIWVDTGSGSFVDVIARDLPTEFRTPDRPHKFATWDYKRECYAVNGADKPIRWDGGTATVLPNAPMGAAHVIVYANRLWMGNLGAPDEPTTLRWSELGDPTIWPAENLIEASQPITGLLGGFGTTPSVWSGAPAGQLWVFEPGRIEVLIGDGGRETTLGFRTVVDGVGCVAPNTLVAWGGYAWFLADDGFYRFDGRSVREVSRRKLGATFANTPPLVRQKAWAAVGHGLIWLAVPEGGSLENQIIYVYDPVWEWWSRFRIAATSIFGTPGNPNEDLELLFGDTQGNVWRYRPDSREDARIPPDPGQPITGTWRSKVFIPSPNHIFQFRRLRAQIRASDGEIFLGWNVDHNRINGSFQFAARVPQESLWDLMLWDDGFWADEGDAPYVFGDSFPMRAQGRSLELEVNLHRDAGLQSLQIIGYAVRELR